MRDGASSGRIGQQQKVAPRGPRKPLKRLVAEKKIKVNCKKIQAFFRTIPRIFQEKSKEIKGFPRLVVVGERGFDFSAATFKERRQFERLAKLLKRLVDCKPGPIGGDFEQHTAGLAEIN